ncbi:MAG TPA: hypothetical protein VFR02_00140, partial [bacterium]|nr:hypothetical protein [bacterium]
GLPMGVVKNRFINQLLQLPGEWAALEGRFRSDPPRFFVLRDTDEVPPPPDWLRAALERDYRLEESMAGFELYVRRPGPPAFPVKPGRG